MYTAEETWVYDSGYADGYSYGKVEGKRTATTWWLVEKTVPSNARRVLVCYNFGTAEEPEYEVYIGEYWHTKDSTDKEQGFGKFNDKAVAWCELPEFCINYI